MSIFYSQDASKSRGAIIGDDHRHCAKVLRHCIGDEIEVFDGKGVVSYAIISDVTKSETLFSVISSQTVGRPSNLKAIAIAPTKSPDRLEWFVEKATEIGINDIYLIQCERSEKTNVNIERLQRLALSATKQSKHLWVPEIHDINKLPLVIQKVKDYQQKFIAHCNEPLELVSGIDVSKSSIVFIGPEGDFSVNEVKTAISNSFIAIGLGTSRLRTETAGVVAATLIAISK